MENSIIKTIREVEQECDRLKNRALLDKNNMIEEAQEKVETMELHYQNMKQDIRKETLQETKLKNDKVMEAEVLKAKQDIDALLSLAKEKEQGVISLVMSLIA